MKIKTGTTRKISTFSSLKAFLCECNLISYEVQRKLLLQYIILLTPALAVLSVLSPFSKENTRFTFVFNFLQDYYYLLIETLYFYYYKTVFF